MSALALVVTYAGLAASGVEAARAGRRRGEIAAAARGAWCAAVGGVCAVCASAGWTPQAVGAGVAWSVGPAAWAFAGALDRGKGRWVVAGVGATLCAVAGLAGGGLAEALLDALAVGIGVALAEAMRARRWRAFRVTAYAVSLLGTFAGILPLSVSGDGGTGGGWRFGAVTGLLLVAAPLGVAGARGLWAAGGTPEPLDPPVRLCTGGIYAWIRHPLQLAEVLVVAAGALAVGGERAGVYAVCFAVGMFGPMRILEERGLRRRYGEAFERYRATVGAYVPRWRRAGGGAPR